MFINTRLISYRNWSTTLKVVKRVQSTKQGFSQLLFNNDSYYNDLGRAPFIYSTIGGLLDSSPDRFHDEFALIDKSQNIRKTFVQFKEDVNKLASGFLALNLKKGDRLAIWGPNRYEWNLSQIAAIKAGLIAVPINPVYQAPEVEFCLKKVGIKSIIFPERFYVQEYYKILNSLLPEIAESKRGNIKSKNFPNLETLIVMDNNLSLPGTFTLNEVMNAGGSSEVQQLSDLQLKISADDPAMILFTSGTTSKPKGAVLTHFDTVNSAVHVSSCLNFFEQRGIICCYVPMFHVFGSVGAGLVPIVTGSTTVFPSPEYNITKALKAIEDEKCTALFGTPTMYIDVIRHPNFSKTNTSSIKTIFGGGARFTPELIRQIFKSFPQADVHIGYGSTESIGMGATGKFEKEWTDEQLNHQGKISRGLEVKIVNSNNQIVPLNVEGELCSRSPMQMKKYWDDETKTGEVFKDGWYYTGDIASLSPEGYLTIAGRIKELIIRGGENINPKEIEDVLVKHPYVIDAQVIGVDDERLGEDVCAWIRLVQGQSLTAEEVKTFCKGKLSHYKIPKYIRFVDKYPLTASGKVQKFMMTEEMNKFLKENLRI